MELRAIDFCVKHSVIIICVIATLAAILIRYKLLRFESGDYIKALLPWFETLKEGGGLPALANFPGDYNAPYVTILALLTYLPIRALYTIKAVSILFDFALAVSCAYLVYTLLKNQKVRKFWTAFTYIVVLFLPQVFLNSAYWGQCDAIFGCFCVLAITLLIKERYSWSFICLGLAMAFKLQFIFILPVFIVYYFVKRKFSIFNFLLVPLVNFILCLPAIIAGKPIMDCLLIYANQTQTFADHISMNYINFYSIFNADPTYWNLVGSVFTIMICALVLFWILHHKIRLDAEQVLLMTIWFSIVIPFFLPGMHERYLYVGEVLSVVYYIIYRKYGYIALLTNAYAWIMYSQYFTGATPFNYGWLALIELGAIAFFTKQLIANSSCEQEVKGSKLCHDQLS